MEEDGEEVVLPEGPHNLSAGTSGSVNADVNVEEEPKKKARKPRKRKSLARRVVRRKRRNQKKGDSSTSTLVGTDQCTDSIPPIGFEDQDLTECLFSDDEKEAREEYLRDVRHFMSRGCWKGDECIDKSLDIIQPEGSLDLLNSDVMSGSASGSTQGRMLSPTPSSSMLSLIKSEPSDLPLGIDTTTSPVRAGPSRREIEQPPSPPPSPPQQDPPPPQEVILATLECLRSKLPPSWIPVADQSGVSFLQLSSRSPKAIQKEILMSYDGVESIAVHLVPLECTAEILKGVSPDPTKLTETTRERFCERGLKIIQRLNQYSVCVGANDDRRKELWGAVPNCYVDNNIFKEDHYSSTCRSKSCSWLILAFTRGKRQRCLSCASVLRNLRARSLNITPGFGVNNRFLSNEELLMKLRQQHGEIRRRDGKIAYLTKKLNAVPDDEGVDMEED